MARDILLDGFKISFNNFYQIHSKCEPFSKKVNDYEHHKYFLFNIDHHNLCGTYKN